MTGRWCPLVIANEIGLPLNDALHKRFMSATIVWPKGPSRHTRPRPLRSFSMRTFAPKECPAVVAGRTTSPETHTITGTLKKSIRHMFYLKIDQKYHFVIRAADNNLTYFLVTIPHPCLSSPVHCLAKVTFSAHAAAPAVMVLDEDLCSQRVPGPHTDAEQQHPAEPNDFIRLDQSGSNGAEGSQPPQLADADIFPGIQQSASEAMMTTAPPAAPTAADPLSFLDRAYGVCRYQGCGKGFYPDPRRQDNLTRHGQTHQGHSKVVNK
ncbi:hypothetical protein PtA15_6A689 [Puccinia triticina]|uniref:C2H2-type domain-containing protein n=1 Tax=Puccinia triticina TaxID=208348 RepID=A0ABY7CLN3_9BASI|nr:uncharacterized protein PtA15_6A689 [Puccinia triticina]WAQ86059.1 hypothetical protein PtA15_6A689 [Puccinia triticina]WAR55952.1 hypothetical protein PtB15_6B696 [Puccinia triticina]